jgi:plastocyanin
VEVVGQFARVTFGAAAGALFEYFCEDDRADGLAKCEGTVLNGASLDTSGLGAHTAQVTATDRAGNTATAVVEYEVLEEAPLVLSADATLVAAGTTVNFTVEASSVDQHIITWDFGDGATAGPAPDPDGGSATASHLYDESGVYPVMVTVEHESGLIQTATLNFIVVYDPSAGFVTGGGWIDSPPGAYTPSDPTDPDIVGVAEFGFVSRYKKGQTVPAGNTSFEFASAGLDFSSTSYDWLVVQGLGKAAFKGVGVIAGVPGEFQFRITVWDADVNESDSLEVDRFRMQIWTTLPNGEDYFVYDNGFGVDPDLDDQGGTTELGGGSIVIHVPKGGKGPN